MEVGGGIWGLEANGASTRAKQKLNILITSMQHIIEYATNIEHAQYRACKQNRVCEIYRAST